MSGADEPTPEAKAIANAWIGDEERLRFLVGGTADLAERYLKHPVARARSELRRYDEYASKLGLPEVQAEHRAESEREAAQQSEQFGADYARTAYGRPVQVLTVSVPVCRTSLRR